MIRLIPRRRIRVPDRAAALAALLLVASSFFTLPGDDRPVQNAAAAYEVSLLEADHPAADAGDRPKRKLSISLLLFGQG
jgi:hypothetical protein